MKPSNWHTIEITDKYIKIQDDGPWSEHKTVTNDAERIVAVFQNYLHGRRLLYIDSLGQDSEILYINQKIQPITL